MKGSAVRIRIAPFNETRSESGFYCFLGEQLILQRGFDITSKQCQKGIYPVISSGGISAYHSEYKVLGPGVLLGRKGSVGRVHYVEENYWPHDTTLWVKDFKGNHPIFVYYFFKWFPISHYEASTSNPTLNRNRLHPVEVLWPPPTIQNRFAAIFESVSRSKKVKEYVVLESNNLFNSLLQRAFLGEL
ncbi:MAG: restriction endonuclease subunit S [Chroococcidiopsidaceae cyanobacterium CP_BM_RX_35]|nr:restriction endonuclease subunit S [Chroococcidiopsidaceae cyanobacterium CP_BM_RX_35]